MRKEERDVISSQLTRHFAPQITAQLTDLIGLPPSHADVTPPGTVSIGRHEPALLKRVFGKGASAAEVRVAREGAQALGVMPAPGAGKLGRPLNLEMG